MIRLELEVLINEIWNNEYVYYCNTYSQIDEKIKDIKKRYALHNKEYRIFVVYQSKMNADKKGM